MQGYERDQQLLRDLVKFTGLKPAALARESKVAVTTINRPYSGAVTTRLSQPTLDKLRARFPEYPGWSSYFGSRRAADEDHDAISMAYTSEELGWLDLLKHLDPNVRDGLLQVARAVTARASTPTVHESPVDFWDRKLERERGEAGSDRGSGDRSERGR